MVFPYSVGVVMMTPFLFLTYNFKELTALRLRLFVESERIPREEGAEVEAGDGVKII